MDLYRVSTAHVLLSFPAISMAKHDQQIERLGQVLDKSLKRMEISTQLDEYGVWPIWNDIVGTTIARNAQPEKIRNGTLFVKVTSPVWMQQLQYMKEMIAEKLNQRLKTDVVKNIFFVVGRIHIETPDVDSMPTATSSAAGQDSRPDEDFLESIRDPEIRQAFKRLLKGYSRRHRKS
jgi:predicted nucleic acid-binding Zn ribbon protein